MSEELGGWDAYVEAVVRIESPGGARWLKPAPIFRTEGEYPDPDGRLIAVLTAHNPAGRRRSAAANAAAQAQLQAQLRRRGLTWWPADGGDAAWAHVEAGAALVGVSTADAIALGAEFGQQAIFLFTVTERRVVSCTDGRVEATGWYSELARAVGQSTGATHTG